MNTMLLIIAGCLLVVFLLYKEWTRKRCAHLPARLLASVIAVSALVGLSYKKVDRDVNTKHLVLLTEGYVRDSVKVFLQKKKEADVFASAENTEKAIEGFLINPVIDCQSFANAYPHTIVHVFGNGLDKRSLQLLAPMPIVFHATPGVPAITQVNWQKNLSTGEALTVQGHYINSTGRKIKLALKVFGSIKDTAVIDAGQEKDFSLQAIPLHTGRAIYSLLAIAGKDTLQREPVPVYVNALSALKILIVAAAPDFENTYLKNYLSQQGYSVVTNTAVSTNVANRQFLNASIQKNQTLSSSYINQFDVLMTDAETLRKMDRSARAAVASSVELAGVGLLVRMDSVNGSNDFYAKFFHMKKLQQNRSALQLHECTNDRNRYTLKIADPESLVAATGTQPLLLDEASNAFASAVLYGNGKIVGTTLSNTYSMALAGNMGAYRGLWSFLLNRVSKKIHADSSWLITPAIPYINQPVSLQAVFSEALLQKPFIGNSWIDVQPDQELSFLYNGIYWPMTAGWQANPSPGDTVHSWYAFHPGEWSGITAHANRRQTLQYEKQYRVSEKAQTKSRERLDIFLPLLLFLLFLGSCGFLWMEQKAG